jgi:hypothetical protein
LKKRNAVAQVTIRIARSSEREREILTDSNGSSTAMKQAEYPGFIPTAARAPPARGRPKLSGRFQKTAENFYRLATYEFSRDSPFCA